jgi:hypothetical protein
MPVDAKRSPAICLQDVTHVETGGHMNILMHSRSICLPSRRVRSGASSGTWSYSSSAASRTLAFARQRRERILACLALIMLVVAWDATLRLDEQMSPPRMRMSHAVEMEEGRMLTAVE